MKNINYTLWKQYMKFPSTSDFLKWGYLVSKVHTHWVYTFIGQHGYTYIVTVMKGAHVVKVLSKDNILYVFTDVLDINETTFTRYIQTNPNSKDQYIAIRYHNKVASLLTSTKNTAVLNIIPIPSQFWLETYQSLWNISQILLRRQPIGTKIFHGIDWLLSHIIKVGYYPLIETGLDLDQIYCEKDGRDFTIIFNNNTLMYRDIYIGLFYALKSNLILNTKDIRIAI